MKKKLLIVSSGMEPGGIERSLLGLLDEIDYDLYEADLLLFSVSGPFLPFINKNVNVLPQIPAAAAMTKPVKEIAFSHPGVALVRAAAKLGVKRKFGDGDAADYALLSAYHSGCLRFLPRMKKEYDLCIAYCWPHDYAAKKVKAEKKIAFIHTDYGAAKLDFKKDEKIWARFDGIAAVSDEVGEVFKKLYPSLAGRVFTAENIMPVKLLEEQAEEAPEETLRRGDETVILSVGRFCYPKAFEVAVKSAALMRDDGLDFKWYLIGYGPDERLIRDEIKKNKIEDRFIILGKKNNPYPYFAACDIYAQPSRYEGKAVTVREAQTLGRPVLITDYPTAPSQVEDGVDGVICPFGAENVAKALEELIRDEDLRRRLSEKCLERDYSNKDALKTILEYERQMS